MSNKKLPSSSSSSFRKNPVKSRVLQWKGGIAITEQKIDETRIRITKTNLQNAEYRVELGLITEKLGQAMRNYSRIELIYNEKKEEVAEMKQERRINIHELCELKIRMRAKKKRLDDISNAKKLNLHLSYSDTSCSEEQEEELNPEEQVEFTAKEENFRILSDEEDDLLSSSNSSSEHISCSEEQEEELSPEKRVELTAKGENLKILTDKQEEKIEDLTEKLKDSRELKHRLTMAKMKLRILQESDDSADAILLEALLSEYAVLDRICTVKERRAHRIQELLNEEVEKCDKIMEYIEACRNNSNLPTLYIKSSDIQMPPIYHALMERAGHSYSMDMKLKYMIEKYGYPVT